MFLRAPSPPRASYNSTISYNQYIILKCAYLRCIFDEFDPYYLKQITLYNLGCWTEWLNHVLNFLCSTVNRLPSRQSLWSVENWRCLHAAVSHSKDWPRDPSNADEWRPGDGTQKTSAKLCAWAPSEKFLGRRKLTTPKKLPRLANKIM